MRVCGQLHTPAALPPGKKPAAHCKEAGWDAGLVWTGAVYLALTGIRSLDCTARS
jgi:hypothetical protein